MTGPEREALLNLVDELNRTARRWRRIAIGALAGLGLLLLLGLMSGAFLFWSFRAQALRAEEARRQAEQARLDAIQQRERAEYARRIEAARDQWEEEKHKPADK